MFDYTIDTGNKQIKTMHNTFISGLVEQDVIPAMTSDSDYIRYNGKYYVLSNQRIMYKRDKSEDEQFFILSLMGLVKELEIAEREGKITYQKNEQVVVNVLCGLPPAHMSDKDLKTSYKNMFKKPDPFKVVYRGRTWTIKINRVTLYVQCYAALMTHYSDIKNDANVLGLDIGGFTADYILLKHGQIRNIENTDSLESGVIILYQRIKRECIKRYDTPIEESDIDDIIAGNPGMYEKAIVDTVNKMAQNFVDELLALFRERQIDLKHTKVVFMGGGSLLLRQYIEKSPLITSYMFIDNINANAAGYKFLNNVAKTKK